MKSDCCDAEDVNASIASHTAAVVAIALPVYNGADHLEEALLSFQNQSYPHFEMLICDNASNDSTAEIAQRFARSDSRFTHCRQTEFLNARDNFIRAYRLTGRKGKYFLWACDDNVWHPEFLEETVGYMEQNQGCSVCGVFLHHFGGNDDADVHVPLPKVFERARLLQFAFERSSVVSIYGLIRRSAIDSVNLNLPAIRDYPDRYYLIQLRSRGHFHVIERDLLAFRAGGISSSGDDPWVRTVIDTNFGEQEMRLLFSFPQITRFEKAVLALKFTYVALRHNIPATVRRPWLLPAYALAALMNRIRPSHWRITNRGLQKKQE
jgi:glycosyltransferase involved in cell wall biosynthesis